MSMEHTMKKAFKWAVKKANRSLKRKEELISKIYKCHNCETSITQEDYDNFNGKCEDCRKEWLEYMADEAEQERIMEKEAEREDKKEERD